MRNNLSEKQRYLIIDIIRLILFIFGVFVLAFGVSMVIKANLGVPTWDVLHIGLYNLIGLSIGRWVQIIGVAMILITAFFEKTFPSIGGIINIILVGVFLNALLTLDIFPTNDSLVIRIPLLLIGILIMGIGSGIYVSTKVGAGPRDGTTLLIAKRFSLSIGLSRSILELSALTIGWLVGGPVSIGTFISVPIIGPVMQISLKLFKNLLNRLYKILKLSNSI